MGQAIVNGFLIGGVYGLVGVALTLVFGVLRVINFAHGEFLMVAMYVVLFTVTGLTLGVYMSLIVVVPVMFVFGAIIFWLVLKPALKSAELNQLLVTLGVSLILQNLALSILSPDVQSISDATFSRTFEFAGLQFGKPHLFAIGASMVTVAVLFWFLRRTRWGRLIRAASEDSQAAMLCGVNIDVVFALTFGLGAACLGVAAAVLTPFYFTAPDIGLFFTLIAFVVVVLGGLGSVFGALVAGFIVGIAESVGAILLPGSYSRVAMYAVFIIFLLFRPQGIFGESRL